ncbi:MAG: hypothetical protein LBH80_02785 [Prevotellaceae bacterium]|jgi:hypothetical protein|nr:hypothetical protein [Prevotellaceae bacterium]
MKNNLTKNVVTKNVVDEFDNLLDCSTGNNLVNDLAEEFNDRFESGIKNLLATTGFTFRSREEFHNFCKKRLRTVPFKGKSDTQEIRLDYIDPKNTGVLIGYTSQKTTTHLINPKRQTPTVTTFFEMNICFFDDAIRKKQGEERLKTPNNQL